jgi:DNA topoisomerase-1
MSRRRPDPSVRAARSAGLRYVTDYLPGIRRRRCGRGFVYLDPKGKRIRNADKIRRIRSLAVPPAWTDVWICPFPNGHIQVTARDAKGRKQYRYHPRFRAVRDESKFDRMLAFSQVLPMLRERVENDLSSRGLSRRKILAATVRLLERTLIRVGSPRYTRENRSFGLTTLRSRHVRISGSNVRFRFRGKSGVRHTTDLSDPRIARIVQRCMMLPGQSLFQYLDGNGRRQRVGADDINDYLRQTTGRTVTTKDFRTWAGTMIAAAALRDLGSCGTKKKAKANLVRTVDLVAERLGNTRAVCRKYYIHPVVLEAYLEGRVLPPAPPAKKQRRTGRTAALRRDEAAVLQFLHRELARKARRA